RIPLLRDELADPLCRHQALVLEELLDRRLVRLELADPRRALIARRPLGAHRPAHGHPAEARPAGDLADRHSLDEMQPPDFGPLLHPDHDLPPRSPTWRGAGPTRVPHGPGPP